MQAIEKAGGILKAGGLHRLKPSRRSVRNDVRLLEDHCKRPRPVFLCNLLRLLRDVECGVLSNPEEAALLSEKEYQEKMAEAIVSEKWE